MVTLTIILIMSVIALCIATAAVIAGGSLFILLFADVIACVIFIVWIMKRMSNRKKKG